MILAIIQAEVIPNAGLGMQSVLRGLLGLFVLLAIAIAFSADRKNIAWKTVGIGLLIQFTLAIGILRIGWIQSIFEAMGELFVSILDFTNAGSIFLFGDLMNVDSYGFIFVFQILPTIVFFAALTSLLFYLGVIQVVVKFLALGVTKVLKISGAESLSVIGNIFLGQTEAPLMIKAYLERMNKSEILLVMIGGMATVAGGVLAAYIGFLGGNDPVMRLEFAKHLLAASVMAAPGAIVIAKILYPQTESINNEVSVSIDNIGSNALDAISNGTVEGIKLATTIGGMLLVFVALIAMCNGILGWVGDWTTLNDWVAANTIYDGFSLEAILGFLFAPLMWLIGVTYQECAIMGQLLGVKIVSSEFVAFIQLADLKNIENSIELLSKRSITMATFMLCGFANLTSIGIQIGGIGVLAPGQRKNLSKLGFKAMIAGTIVSLISACFAGVLTS